jgi:type IV secretory pathway TrbL component
MHAVAQSAQADDEDDLFTASHPGLLKRCKRFVQALLSSATGSSPKASASKRSSKSSSKSSSSSKKSAKSSSGNSAEQHLATKHKPGNLNYRLQKELKEFMTSPPDGCQVCVCNSTQ